MQILFLLLLTISICNVYIKCFLTSKLFVEDSLKNALEKSPIILVQGVKEGSVLLPCNVTAPTVDDFAILVLFYIENKKTPIYSLDSRGSTLLSAHHWHDPDFRGRISLQVDTDKHGLILHELRPYDAGVYRCRVDFKSSPTRNTRVRLMVVEPPLRMLITSTWEDERIVHEVAGPFPVLANVSLSCQVIGGNPLPLVTWWHENTLLDDRIDSISNQLTQNTLNLPPLTRDDLMKKLTCSAVNSNLTAPLTSILFLDLAFAPDYVKISEPTPKKFPKRKNKIIHVNERENNTVRCFIFGSRPEPQINWYLAEEKLIWITNYVKMADKNVTDVESAVTFVPTNMDNGSKLTCRSFNPRLPDYVLFDIAILNVLYKPRVTLSAGSTIDLASTREGNDVYFECYVDANPAASEIFWFIYDKPLLHNASAGISVLSSSTTTSLILQDITSQFNGNLSCEAKNSRGSQRSNVLELNVKSIPTCVNKVTTINGTIGQVVNPICDVRAHPPPTQHRWAFNSSKGLFELKSESKNDATSSFQFQKKTIPFSIESALNFGDFLCWATNELGTMFDPCLIKINHTGIRQELTGCKIGFNSTIPGGAVWLDCTENWNSRTSDYFTLEVRQSSSYSEGVPVVPLNLESPVPRFFVRNLEHDAEYIFTLTSNEKEWATYTTLKYTVPGETIAGLRHVQSGIRKSLMRLLPVMGAVTVSSLSISLLVLTVIFFVRRRHQNDDAPTSEEEAHAPDCLKEVRILAPLEVLDITTKSEISKRNNKSEINNVGETPQDFSHNSVNNFHLEKSPSNISLDPRKLS